MSELGIAEKVLPSEAARELSIDIRTFYYMMQHEMLPIGMAFRKEGQKQYTYYIYRGLLDAYKKKICGEESCIGATEGRADDRTE